LVKGAVALSAFAARQGHSLEHTTLVGFSILVIEPDDDCEHYLRRTLYGAGAHVLAPRTSKDAIRIADELEVSAAVLDYNESQATRHVVAMRLTELRIPFIFCADAGQTCAPLVIPVLYRPTIGTELIEMLRQLRPLTSGGYPDPSNRLAASFERFSGAGRAAPHRKPKVNKPKASVAEPSPFARPLGLGSPRSAAQRTNH